MYLAAYQSAIDSVALEFRMDAFQMGFLIAAHFIGSMASPPLMGGMAGKFGMTAALTTAFALSGGGMAVMALSAHWAFFCAGVVLMGCGFAALASLLTSTLTMANPDAVGRTVNRSQMWFCIGAVVSAPVVNAFIVAGLGWRAAFWSLIPAYLALGYVFLRLLGTHRISAPEGESGVIPIPKYFLICMCIAMALYVGVEQGVGFFIGTHFVQTGQSALSAPALSGFWGGMILGRMAGGHMKINHRSVTLWGLAGSVPLLLLLPHIPDVAGVAIFALVGLLISTCWPLLATMVADRCTGPNALAMGWLMTAGACGGAACPPLIGYMVRFFGTGAGFALVAVLLAGIIALVAVGSASWIRRGH